MVLLVVKHCPGPRPVDNIAACYIVSTNAWGSERGANSTSSSTLLVSRWCVLDANRLKANAALSFCLV